MSSKLNALLLSEHSPVIGPNNAQALREWVERAAAYEASLQRPTEGRVQTLIARLAMATAFRHTSKDEAKEAHLLYWRTLRELPLIDLAAGFDDLIRSATFMSKPAEIRAAARRHTAFREHRLSRARWLVRKHEREWVPPVVDLVDPAEVAALLARTMSCRGVDASAPRAHQGTDNNGHTVMGETNPNSLELIARHTGAIPLFGQDEQGRQTLTIGDVVMTATTFAMWSDPSTFMRVGDVLDVRWGGTLVSFPPSMRSDT